MAESAPSRPPLALIANDQEWSIRSLESILAPDGYAVIRAYSGQQATELALDSGPDLLIIDANFPDMTGIEVCRQLKDDPRISPCAPILITTSGRWTRQQRLEALSAGAWDFLGLPLDAEELLLKLRNYIKLKFEADKVKEESYIDQLTGLYNLKGLMRRARELATDAYRNARPLACVALAPDLRSDESLSAEAANQALWAAVDRLAEVFKASGRISDAIGRVRLGEFVVVAPGTDSEGARKLAQRMVAIAESSEQERVGALSLVFLAGYDAVENMRESGAHPGALLASATTALRQSQAEPGGPAIRRYTNGA